MSDIMGSPVLKVNRFSGSFPSDNIGMSIGTRVKQARKAAKMTQVELAKRSGLNQSTISDLEVGKSHGTTYLATLATVLGVNALWLETGKGPMSHASGSAEAVGPVHGAAAPANDPAAQTGGPGLEKRQAPREQPFVRSMVTAYDPEDGVPDDVVLVPESKITFAGGDGHINYELVEHEEPATYRRAWFQKYGINPDRARRFRVSGDSMEPLLYARDTILVNLDETEVVDGRLYALRYGEQLRVKYLSKRLDGTLILRSVNPAYKDEIVPAELANEHITVIGRVRDRSGTGGL